jgi:FAD:protein FMN transferase
VATGDLRFRAMGTDCHVLVVVPGGLDDPTLVDDLGSLARDRVELLEQAWSRFRPDSELTRLNAAAGSGPQHVSADLLLLTARMHDAWAATGGLFDPTVLASVRALGYDADFAAVAARPAALVDVTLAAAPGMSGVHVDPTASTVDLPAGIGLDAGAIGKGLAADVICDDLMAAGVTGVLVNLGGDIAFAGSAPDDAPWTIGVEDERRPADDPARILRVLQFDPGTDRGGVATSTTLKRRWAQGRRHHVIDPRTGGMSTSALVQVTVVAGSACAAETTATTALLQSPDDAAAWLQARDLTGILLTSDAEFATDEEHHDG